ncbi:SDR family oxidoreductase [Actinocorallia libanotica]|uniref:NAD(P)H-binding protein n=1 Tax=Actinocorallia libanotica TaxID=46162 RepID=A0ABN1R574_9ACTN
MIVVTGATGNVGLELVRILNGAGEPVAGVSRRAVDLPGGAPHHRGDIADPEGIRPLLEKADALFLLVAGELLAGGPDPAELLRAVRESGVRKVVLMSSQAVGTRPGAVSHARLHAYEEAVRGSGLDWTILRPGGFMTNAFAWIEPIRAHRTAAAPFADTGLPLVDPADIAACAAVVLREPGHAGRVHELTGPALSTPRRRAEEIGAALGEPVRFVEQTREEARAQMLTFMPEPVVEGTLSIIGEPTPAEQKVGHDVEYLLGRPPRAFARWAEAHADAFRAPA